MVLGGWISELFQKLSTPTAPTTDPSFSVPDLWAMISPKEDSQFSRLDHNTRETLKRQYVRFKIVIFFNVIVCVRSDYGDGKVFSMTLLQICVEVRMLNS